MFVIGVVRNLDHAVGGLILEELPLALLQYADHLIGDAVHQDGFAEAVVSGEKVLVDFVADDRDVHAVGVFKLGKEAALRQVGVVHIGVGSGGAAVIEVGDFLPSVA